MTRCELLRIFLCFIQFSAFVNGWEQVSLAGDVQESWPNGADAERRCASSKQFTLRHAFHSNPSDRVQSLHFLDVPPGRAVWTSENGSLLEPVTVLRARSQSMKIHRLADRGPEVVNRLLQDARIQGEQNLLADDSWTLDSVVGPDLTDKETVISLAKMTSDAYVLDPSQPDWLNYSIDFNHTGGFGWGKPGLRGHVFVDHDNSTVIIAIKGTSLFFGDTASQDLTNDNLLFSCCCGQQGRYLWRKVCSCRTKTFTCDQRCLAGELLQEDRYYPIALRAYANISAMYPDSNIWLAGHSLGGVMSSLVGLTFGLPVTTFEAVPNSLAAVRLGLPLPPDTVGHRDRRFTGAYHFGHTADPVYMGSCNGFLSTCTLAGFAFESQCFSGSRCVYDTVGDKGWRMTVNTHRINNVIPNVLEAYDEVPTCEPDDECVDCSNWYFKDQSSLTFH